MVVAVHGRASPLLHWACARFHRCNTIGDVWWQCKWNPIATTTKTAAAAASAASHQKITFSISFCNAFSCFVSILLAAVAAAAAAFFLVVFLRCSSLISRRLDINQQTTRNYANNTTYTRTLLVASRARHLLSARLNMTPIPFQFWFNRRTRPANNEPKTDKN